MLRYDRARCGGWGEDREKERRKGIEHDKGSETRERECVCVCTCAKEKRKVGLSGLEENVDITF